MKAELLNRIVFCSYFALFAILVAVNTVVCWIDKKIGAFLISLLATLGSLAAGVLFFFACGHWGFAPLAFGIPLLLGIVFHFVRALKR